MEAAGRADARGLEAEGKTVLFYLIGRKGRAVIRRAYPKAILDQFDTTHVREPGYSEAEQIADALLACKIWRVLDDHCASG